MQQVSLLPFSWLMLLLTCGILLAVFLWTRIARENKHLREANEDLEAVLAGRPVPARRPRPRATLVQSPGWVKPALAGTVLLPCLGLGLAPFGQQPEALPPRLSAPQVLTARVVSQPALELERPALKLASLNRGAAMTACAPISYRQARRIASASSNRTGVSPELILAVIHHESRFSPCAISSSGAQGLMQLKPATAWEVGVKDPFDPVDNIGGGTRYLGYLLRRYRGDLVMPLGAYKDGRSVFDRHKGLPPERGTQRYVHGIMRMAEDLTSD